MHTHVSACVCVCVYLLHVDGSRWGKKVVDFHGNPHNDPLCAIPPRPKLRQTEIADFQCPPHMAKVPAPFQLPPPSYPTLQQGHGHVQKFYLLSLSLSLFRFFFLLLFFFNFFVSFLLSFFSFSPFQLSSFICSSKQREQRAS